MYWHAALHCLQHCQHGSDRGFDTCYPAFQPRLVILAVRARLATRLLLGLVDSWGHFQTLGLGPIDDGLVVDLGVGVVVLALCEVVAPADLVLVVLEL